MTSHQRPKRGPTAAERLTSARQSAADELGVEITDPKARRLACLQIAYDQCQAAMLTGAQFDIDKLLKLDEALAAARADKPVEKHNITVKIIDATPKALASGVAIEPVDMKGRGWSGTPRPPELRELARQERSSMAQAVATPPAENNEPTAAPARPKAMPKPMTAAEKAAANHKRFHDGGFVRELRATDGWFTNVGALSRRARSESRTIYQPWPNPTRGQ